MDQISSELNKLRIDRSQRGYTQRSGRGKWIVALVILGLLGAVAAYAYLRGPDTVVVSTVRPRLESSNDSPVLVATGYVIAHHKIQVGSKIAGRVAWIGVDKGDRVARNQVVVRLEDREYRAQYDQACSPIEARKRALRLSADLTRPLPDHASRLDSGPRIGQHFCRTRPAG